MFAFRSGGTTVLRPGAVELVIAILTCAVVAAGKSDQSKAMVPVTNGVAALVPVSMCDEFPAPRLTISSPGAPSPFLPIEAPMLDRFNGRPCWLYAATGMTAGCCVSVLPPTVP